LCEQTWRGCACRFLQNALKNLRKTSNKNHRKSPAKFSTNLPEKSPNNSRRTPEKPLEKFQNLYKCPKNLEKIGGKV
jgi:hypothetical protein